MASEQCTYPTCKCIVSTSTSAPVPLCPFGHDPLQGIVEKVHLGKVIDAIKEYRLLSGATFKEAHAWVQSVQEESRALPSAKVLS